MKKYLFAIAAIFLIGCGATEPTEDDINRLNEHASNNTSAPKISANKELTAGSWEIGKKEDISAGVILPGTYIITVPSTGINCYWETVKDFDQTLKSIVANGNVSPGETTRVVVKKSYAGLTLNGDCLGKKKS